MAIIEIRGGTSAAVGLPQIPRVTVNNMPAGGVRQAGLWTGTGPPGVVPGARAKDEYLDRLTGDLYELGDNMATWELVTNIKGPAGDTTLDASERQALIDLASLETQQDLTPPVDLTVLFENALAG